jgi:uncharacterized membrane protein
MSIATIVIIVLAIVVLVALVVIASIRGERASQAKFAANRAMLDAHKVRFDAAMKKRNAANKGIREILHARS